MKGKLLFLLSLICLTLFFLSSSTCFAEDKPKSVLILNSYHEGFTWTREQTLGAIDIFLKSKLDIKIHVEYMDWKNYPTNENLHYLYDYLRYKYKDKKIDLVLTTDDKALQFAMETRKDLFLDAPVVFSGVNIEGSKNLLAGQTNYTGILQPILPEGALQLALQTNPDLKNIYLVYDSTESGQSAAYIAVNSIQKIDNGIKIIHLTRLSYNEILEHIKNAEKNSIVFILSHYMDIEGTTMEFEDFIERAEIVSPVPIFHLFDFTVGHGSIGGSMLSGRLQGENAAKAAIRVLNGESIDSIPVSDGLDTVRRVFDYNKLTRYNIPLKRVEANSEIINRPFSFVRTYRKEVATTAIIFSFLVILISLLIYYIHKQKQIEKKLKYNQEELTQLNEELIITEEELKLQNEELFISQKKLRELAYRDHLTNLPNRLSLGEVLENLLKEESKIQLTLFFIDTDNFKYINDSMGHTAGDELLKLIGKRIKGNLIGEGMLFRFGGDEFVILMENLTEDEVTLQANTLINCFKEPFKLNLSEFHISISIGISTFPEGGTQAEDLIKSGDIAMYHAKAQGKGRYAVFNRYMDYNLRDRIQIEKHLRTALERREFLLHYQPQVEIETRTITGFEALIRWTSPELGFVMPNTFIPVAEETQLIIPIGEWALKEACCFGEELYRKVGKSFVISVNISILQLLQANFVERVIQILNETQLSPELLELEITETILMESYDLIYSKMHELRNHGVRFALDDFGKGYSSLTHLKSLPINTLKIDKFFINESIYNNEDSITGSIIALGLQLGLTVIAEGVEMDEQLNYLSKHKCSKYQGYLFSKPISAEEALRMASSAC